MPLASPGEWLHLYYAQVVVHAIRQLHLDMQAAPLGTGHEARRTRYLAVQVPAWRHQAAWRPRIDWRCSQVEIRSRGQTSGGSDRLHARGIQIS